MNTKKATNAAGAVQVIAIAVKEALSHPMVLSCTSKTVICSMHACTLKLSLYEIYSRNVL